MNNQQESQAFERNWSAYYKAVEGRPPRETLLKALASWILSLQMLLDLL